MTKNGQSNLFYSFEKTNFLFAVILVLLNGLAFLIPVTDNWSKCAAHLISTSDPISTPSLDTIEDLNFSFYIHAYSAVSKMFWTWSKVRFYLINLHIWSWSNKFEHIPKLFTEVKNFWSHSKIIHLLVQIFLTMFKYFWPYSIFFECFQIFLTVLKYVNL